MAGLTRQRIVSTRKPACSDINICIYLCYLSDSINTFVICCKPGCFTATFEYSKPATLAFLLHIRASLTSALRLATLILYLGHAGLAHAQSPDTVFIRQDHDYDDTLIYTTDTVVFESGMRKHLLYGTTVLPYTHHQMGARAYGIYLNNVQRSQCRTQGEVRFKPDRITNLQKTDTSLIIDINITENCCYEFLCDMGVDSSGIINLMYQGYGTYCSCDCCFGITYHMRRDNDPEYKSVRGVMINGDRKNVRYFD